LLVEGGLAVTQTTLVPFLENGDRLSRQEFERRYQRMPQLKKAELIEGVVYMSSPLRYRSHSQPHGMIMTWLGVYESSTPGVEFGDNPTVRLDIDNEPQPDAILRISEDCGGQSYISSDDYIIGAPELVIEIAASSASIDTHDKLRVYRRNGVKEYIIWQVYERKIDWLFWQNGEYIPLIADKQGVIRSQIFPGLELAVNAILQGDLAEVLSQLQKGIETEKHQNFVEELAHRKESTFDN
jgi:Uma2 family endonuclease